MIPIFCPECGIGLSNSEKNVCFCQNCHATWSKHEEKEGWIPAKVECNLCGHKWIAVYQEDSEELECDNCGNMTVFNVIEYLKKQNL